MSEVESKGRNPKKPARCSICDREKTSYYEFVSPTNEVRVVCWECQMREEKNFFTRRNFYRRARTGVIPR
jgi:hypothetical protein